MSGYCEVCGEQICTCDEPSIDWQSTCEMWKRAHDKVDKLASELQDTCHKQAQRITDLEEAARAVVNVYRNWNKLQPEIDRLRKALT